MTHTDRPNTVLALDDSNIDTIQPTRLTIRHTAIAHDGYLYTIAALGLLNNAGYKTEILLTRQKAIEIARALTEFAADANEFPL